MPDFQGRRESMATVMDARPDVLNHNTETVPRLYRQVRLGARYERSLDMLACARAIAPDIPTKSGLMLGLGETPRKCSQVMRDLRAHGVDILTLGQYCGLRRSISRSCVTSPPPNSTNSAVPASEMGFAHVESGPLVRSSYHAARAAG